MKRTLLAAISLLPVLLLGQNGNSTNPASNAEPPEHRAARLKWFQEARFGLFIHWGVYAVPAGEWKGKPVRSCGEWILKLGEIPIAEYKTFAPQFTASKYDPKAWAALAKEAGCKYVVITSKHHDGFALYDSVASDWNAVKASGAKRDLLTPLAEAVRAEGLKFGLYYSQAQDWVHKGGGIYGYKEGEPGWDPSHRGSFDEYLKSVALPQVREILARYKPSVIWWDTPAYMTAERARPFAEALRELAPEIISNDRLGGGFGGDTGTPEQHIPPRGYPGKMFEVCMTMNHTWGFKKDDQNWKSARELIRNLSDISSKGGNFLLNVGPTAEGEIPQASVERLKAIGRWMAVNGQAIYATEASPFPRRMTWGRCTQKKDAKGGFTLYLHVWEWPQEGKILLPTHDVPVAGQLLQGGGAVTSRATADGLEVSLPASAPDTDVSVVALQFAGPLSITQEAFMSPGKDGGYTFQALDADNYGNIFGNFQLVGRGVETYLSNWRDAGWYLEYSLKTSAGSKWRVSAEIAAEKPVALEIIPGNKGAVPVSVEIPATGKPGVWQTVDLGIVKLAAGETSFQLKPVKKGWNTIHVRRVWLKPASDSHETDGSMQFLERLKTAPTRVEDTAGNLLDASRVTLTRNWDGERCAFSITNADSQPVKLKNIILFDLAEHQLDPATPIYGEAFQKLCQYGGTLGRVAPYGSYSDLRHYKIPEPDGLPTVYGMMTLDFDPQRHILLGFTSCNRFIGRFSFDKKQLRISVDPEGLELGPGETWKLEEFIAMAGADRNRLLEKLAERINQNHPPLPQPALEKQTGWCTWYGVGGAGNQKLLTEAAALFSAKLPRFKFMQIDEGYTVEGDLLDCAPWWGNLHQTCDAIRERGLLPGLWVGPFVASIKDSKVLKEHPDWFVKGEDGLPLNSSSVSFGGWKNGPWAALDGTNPEAQKWLEHVFQTYRQDYGITYFKLDANFWGAIHGGKRFDPKATRIEAYRRGMEAVLRGAGPDAVILGCNAPMWPSFGLVNVMRTGLDIARSFGSFNGTAKQNFSRGWQNGKLWVLDPDCVLLGGVYAKPDLPIPPNVRTLHATVIHACGGMILSGDKIPDLGDEAIAILDKLTPPTGKSAVFEDFTFKTGVTDLGDRQYYYAFNWDKDPVDRSIHIKQRSQLSDFWTGENLGTYEGEYAIKALPGQSARLLVAVPDKPAKGK